MTLAPVPGGRDRRRRAALVSAGLVASVVVAWMCFGASRIDTSGAGTLLTTSAAVSGQVAFEDEFDGPAGAPADPSRWTAQVGGRWNYGKDAQYYTPGPHNAALTGRGSLLISARAETYTGPDGTRSFTSGRLMSKADVRYGHVEARIRLTTMQGAFPAFWLLGSDYPTVGWPTSGELDVMETMNDARRISGGIHGPRSDVPDRKYYWAGGNYPAPGDAWATGWHVYAMDWTATAVSWSIDGTPYARVDREGLTAGQVWAVDTPANLVVNLAVGGYAGTPGANFNASMEIDWIRVTS